MSKVHSSGIVRSSVAAQRLPRVKNGDRMFGMGKERRGAVAVIDRCLGEVMTIDGALGVSLVDWASGLALAVAGQGAGGDHETGALDAAELARTLVMRPTFADPAPDAARLPAEDVIISSAGIYHLIRFLDTVFGSNILIHFRLDRATANLAMARLRLAAITDRLVEAPFLLSSHESSDPELALLLRLRTALEARL